MLPNKFQTYMEMLPDYKILSYPKIDVFVLKTFYKILYKEATISSGMSYTEVDFFFKGVLWERGTK